MQIALRTDVQMKDYLDFISFVRNRSVMVTSQNRTPFIRRLVTFIISLLIGIGVAVSINLFGGKIHLPSAIGAAVLTFVIVVSVIYWQLKKFQNDTLPQPGGSVLGNHLYQFHDDAIHINAPYGTTQLVWRAVMSLEETPAHFFLFIDRSVAFILPKRSFADESAEAQFKAMVTEQCRKFA
jgi:uncharacterized membrane protein